MTALLILIPVSLGLGLLGLLAFFWSVKDNQYEDTEGQSLRILDTRYDQEPASKDDVQRDR